MSSDANHRSNAQYLKNFIDKRVLVIGKVDQINGTEVSLMLSDGTITAHTGDAIPPLQIGSIYEVLGNVVDDSSLKVYQVSEINTSDLPNAEFERKLLKLRAGPAGRGLFYNPSHH